MISLNKPSVKVDHRYPVAWILLGLTLTLMALISFHDFDKSTPI